MGELLDFVASTSERLGIPHEILTGFPVVELTGDTALLVEQHHGICAYSDCEVCINVNIGKLIVSGENLTIRLMSRLKIMIYGKIDSLRFERQAT